MNRSRAKWMRRARGSSLIMVTIILLVMALMAASALILTAQEAGTVSKKIDYDVLVACAQAAQQKLWGEYALYGSGITTVKPTVIPGTEDPSTKQNARFSIGHYDSDPTDITDVTFNDESWRPLPATVVSGSLGEMDQSNTFRRGFGGQPYLVFAHCRDNRGRQYEVELMVRFGL